MKDKTHGGVDINGYTLSINSHYELLALRDELLMMARTIYGTTAEGTLSPMPNLTGAQLALMFKHIAFQLHNVVAAAIPTDHVGEVRSPLH